MTPPSLRTRIRNGTLLMLLAGFFAFLLMPTILIYTGLAGLASAGPAAVVKTHSDAFGSAFNSCDVPLAVSLYEESAVLICPGDGEVATGKAAIGKVMAECAGASKSSLRQIVRNLMP
jgi:hypothetical protein